MKIRNNPGIEKNVQPASFTDEAGVDTKRVAPSQSLSARNRRRFLKGGMFAAGATVLGAGLSPSRLLASQDDDRAPITKGDIAILRFLQALETIEADLWQQYSELGGTQDKEVSGLNGGNVPYTQALQLLDGDMPQYIHDNTDDEISHARFLSNYLESIGAEPVDLTPFAQLPSSKADGARQAGRRPILLSSPSTRVSGRSTVASPISTLIRMRGSLKQFQA